MMDDHAADLDAIIEKQLAVAEVLKRKAKFAKKRRIKEFKVRSNVWTQ